MSSVVPIEQAEVALALVASKRASPIHVPADVAIFYSSMDKDMFFIKGLLMRKWILMNLKRKVLKVWQPG